MDQLPQLPPFGLENVLENVQLCVSGFENPDNSQIDLFEALIRSQGESEESESESESGPAEINPPSEKVRRTRKPGGGRHRKNPIREKARVSRKPGGGRPKGSKNKSAEEKSIPPLPKRAYIKKADKIPRDPIPRDPKSCKVTKLLEEEVILMDDLNGLAVEQKISSGLVSSHLKDKTRKRRFTQILSILESLGVILALPQSLSVLIYKNFFWTGQIRKPVSSNYMCATAQVALKWYDTFGIGEQFSTASRSVFLEQFIQEGNISWEVRRLNEIHHMMHLLSWIELVRGNLVGAIWKKTPLFGKRKKDNGVSEDFENELKRLGLKREESFKWSWPTTRFVQ